MKRNNKPASYSTEVTRRVAMAVAQAVETDRTDYGDQCTAGPKGHTPAFWGSPCAHNPATRSIKP